MTRCRCNCNGVACCRCRVASPRQPRSRQRTSRVSSPLQASSGAGRSGWSINNDSLSQLLVLLLFSFFNQHAVTHEARRFPLCSLRTNRTRTAQNIVQTTSRIRPKPPQPRRAAGAHHKPRRPSLADLTGRSTIIASHGGPLWLAGRSHDCYGGSLWRSPSRGRDCHKAPIFNMNVLTSSYGRMYLWARSVETGA